MKLAYILFLQICLLTISNSYGNCTVNRINNNTATESVLEVLTDNTPKFEKAFTDNNQLEFILSENTFETKKDTTGLFGFPLNLNGKNLRDRCFVYTKSIKLNNKGLLERNSIPFRNVARNILFHNLKIHF
ncbi:hypothetical protein [Flavobacterium granuli]|uniref:Uncharacterized protein n=1 Tax=Flavobacterium granuli TaxID=280093 RepID=A0A1M5RYS4_9FLAO|nr:hypothetical protein [Flavobacterium granuli]PRZ21149.1 hypothetical protein BC624_1092 [Flavobacterium granuli]SHH31396.1 hypothetical protein SAMN05443373_1112 [Flavobacterium granuli]